MTHDEVGAKADVLRENLELLARLPQESFEAFSSDYRNLSSALHWLQTAIQALIDLAGLANARLGLPTPVSSLALFENLEAAGHFPLGTAGRAAPIVGFRNRVVHLYDRIDPRIVHRIVCENRPDLAELLDRLLAILGRAPRPDGP